MKVIGKNLKEFGNEQTGISLTYPEQWIIEETEHGFLFHNPKTTAKLSLSFYNRVEWKEINFDPMKILNEFLHEKEIYCNPARINPTRINQCNAASYDWTERDEGKNELYTKLWVITGPKRSVFIEYSCLEEEKIKEKPVLEKIIQSIQLS